MHKSILTFGLLASSLVMLAITLFLNQNNSLFSNVMAQGYDNYLSDSSYSQYPTGDKKYECRTGPFEGFFVSSVEFCKSKFDDSKRDVKIGPQGPQGIQGVQGPIGPNGTHGLQGPNQINSTSVYTVTGNFSSTAPDGFALSIAMCNLGDTVLSGSYFLNNAADATAVGDFALPTQDGWATVATGTVFAAVQTNVQCFDNP
jgi:hypothetical protein